MAERMSKYIQEIPIDLLKELAAQIRHQDFQPKLVENVTDGRIEAKDVIRPPPRSQVSVPRWR